MDHDIQAARDIGKMKAGIGKMKAGIGAVRHDAANIRQQFHGLKRLAALTPRRPASSTSSPERHSLSRARAGSCRRSGR